MVQLLPGRSRTTKILLGIAAVLFILNFYVFVASRPLALADTGIAYEEVSAPVMVEVPPIPPHKCIRVRTHVSPVVNIDEIRLQTRQIQQRLNDLQIDLHTELETLKPVIETPDRTVRHITIHRF